MVRNVNKLSALRTDPICFSFRSLLELAEVIFSSKSRKKSSIKMFPFNFQLSDDFCEVFGQKSRIGFSVAMNNGRFLCLQNLIWSGLDLCSILLKSSHHEAGLSRKRFYGSDV